MIRISPLPLLLCLFALSACTGGEGNEEPSRTVSDADRTEAARLVAEAAPLLETQKYDEAWPLLRRAHDLDPANPRAARLAAVEPTSPARAEAARKIWQVGVNLMVAGDGRRAYDKFAEASAADPAFDRARLDHARAAVTLRRFDEALERLDAILAEKPDLPRALFAAAEASYRQGDDARCLRYLESLPEIERDHADDADIKREFPELRYLQGVVAHRASKPVVAIRALEAGLAHKPDHLPSRHLLGGVKLEEGQFQEAIKDLKAVLDAKPDHVEAKINLARAYDRAGESKEAINWYRSALAVRKTDWELMISLARCHEELGERRDLLQASSWLERAVEVNPQAHEAYFSLGNVHRRLGNKALSKRYLATYERIKELVATQNARLRDLNRRLQANPRDIEARLEMIAIHEEYHHVEDVLAGALEILRYEPRNPEALRFAALSFKLQGKRDEALYEALKMVDSHPKDARGWALAAWVFRDQERWEECRRYAKRGFDLDPTHFGALENYLAACQKLGDKQELRRLIPLYQKLRQSEEKRVAEVKERDAKRQSELLKALGDE